MRAASLSTLLISIVNIGDVNPPKGTTGWRSKEVDKEVYAIKPLLRTPGEARGGQLLCQFSALSTKLTLQGRLG